MMPILAFALFLGMWGLFMKKAIRVGSVPVVLSLAFFALTHGTRPLMLILGAAPFTAALPPDIGDLASRAMLYVLLYLACAWIAFGITRPILGPAVAVMPRMSAVHFRWGMRWTVRIATVFAIWLIVWQFSRYGSLSDILIAAKIDKALAGTFGLRQIAGLGAIGAFMLAADIYVSRRYSTLRAIPWLAAAGICCFAFSLWGSRMEIGVLLLGFVAALAVGRGGEMSRPVLLKMIFWASILTAIVTWLYIYRLDLLSGGRMRERDLSTTVAISLHMVRFDALMLVVQDFGDANTLRKGEDFLNGVLIAVPRAIWEGKPDILLIGRWFRALYEPWAFNGWAVGVVGEYLLNFGTLGVVVGGMIYGTILQMIHRIYLRLGRTDPFSIMLCTVLTLLVFPEGSIIQALPRFVLWVGPLIVLAIFCRYFAVIGTKSALSGQDPLKLGPTGRGTSR
jgi:hypothetical protein